MLESLFNKVAGFQACNFIKKTTTRMFPCEYCKNFKYSLFYRTPLMAASLTDYFRWSFGQSKWFWLTKNQDNYYNNQLVLK